MESPTDLFSQPAKYRLLPVFSNEDDMVKTIPSDVALFFPFSHRLSPSQTTRRQKGLSLFHAPFNPVSVEPTSLFRLLSRSIPLKNHYRFKNLHSNVELGVWQ